MVLIYECVSILLVWRCSGVHGIENEIQENELRFFFNNNPIKPTAAITHHEPGLPPGWTRPPTRPTNLKYRWLGEQHPQSTTEFIVESQVISLRDVNDGSRNDSVNGLPPGIYPPMALIDGSGPNKNAFVDWILGLFGQRPGTEKPIVTKPPPNNVKCPICSCGISYKYNRIVGGVETKANAYPWMVYLTYSGRFYCGATVINNKYLLTAAHCVTGFVKERMLATFLDHDRSNNYETKTFTRKISNVLRHNSYGIGGTFNNDIALLKLSEPLDFSGLVRPVCLPPIGKSFSGHNGLVIGWGATEEAGSVSNTLREVEVPIMSNMDCIKTGYGKRITDNMMCAGYPEGMKDSCQGDSGGPMHIVTGTVYTIVGVVSWGEGCAEPNYPGVYSRVNRYISWINSNTRDACYC